MSALNVHTIDISYKYAVKEQNKYKSNAFFPQKQLKGPIF